jgi:hypothetical protein
MDLVEMGAVKRSFGKCLLWFTMLVISSGFIPQMVSKIKLRIDAKTLLLLHII